MDVSAGMVMCTAASDDKPSRRAWGFQSMFLLVLLQKDLEIFVDKDDHSHIINGLCIFHKYLSIVAVTFFILIQCNTSSCM